MVSLCREMFVVPTLLSYSRFLLLIDPPLPIPLPLQVKQERILRSKIEEEKAFSVNTRNKELEASQRKQR